MDLAPLYKVQDPWEIDIVSHLGPLPTVDPVELLPGLSVSIEPPEAGDSDLQAAICAIETGDLITTNRVTLKILIEDGAESRRLHYCLLRAACKGNVPLVREVLARGVSVNKETVKVAIKAKALPLFSTFLDAGWDINEPLGPWQPPCLSLCIHDRDLVAWLLANGADPNRRCEIDLTPLSTAVEAASFEVIKLMFEYGGHIGHGQLLHYAVRRKGGDQMEIVRFILLQGAHVDHVMYQNDLKSYHLQKAFGLGTALHEAARLGRVDVIDLLAAHGANPLIEDSLGRLPLQIAQREANKRAEEALRQMSARARVPEYQFTAAARLQDAWR
ncbi:hypothetical protein BAUCODRAFT_32996 [Baudoinia panamericana UAMH 10762]|uniref:Uncharacterized protein n=1 Tax=Baudoinia panamericana (strain UAMH 10762) TaxID=717646 RepID=M2N013_BAUPA|nr:uncharacterized protein BAUCODRAFT_32996 [Baudoinia panamericana UAMH 10762]EMC97248.1 hypothetical protein BAUCODRAFT_32996 [Baudoinia panamericana UAMH 10762]